MSSREHLSHLQAPRDSSGSQQVDLEFQSDDFHSDSLLPDTSQGRCASGKSLSVHKFLLDKNSYNRSSWRRTWQRFERPKNVWTGWRKGVAVSCLCSSIALILNTALLAWASSKPRTNSGSYVLFTGAQSEVNAISTWAHFGINIMSTIILAGTNYTVQVLLAPTREAIDRAHCRHRPISIGLTSLNGWRYLGWTRRSMFICLMILMLPLHLIYNSTIFSTIAVLETPISGGLVTNDFLNQPPDNSSIRQIWDLHSTIQATNISISDCMKLYTAELKYEYSKVLMFTNISSTQVKDIWNGVNEVNSSLSVDWVSSYDEYCGVHGASWCAEFFADDVYDYVVTTPPGSWIAEVHSDFSNPFDAPYTVQVQIAFNSSLENLLFNISQPLWYATYIQGEYCLAYSPKLSTIELLPQILITIIVCNVLKVAILLITIFMDFTPLVTIGDAIASFLDHPDSYTKSVGPISALDFPALDFSRYFTVAIDPDHDRREMIKKSARRAHRLSSIPDVREKAWKGTQHWYFRGASILRWIVSLGCCLAYLLVGVSFLTSNAPTIYSVNTDWRSGLEGIPNTIIASTASIGGLVLLTNTPQLALSLIYVLYNSLITSMQVSAEFTSYAKQRKGLRVSQPLERQRGTYFLSLPYRFGVPLAVLSMFLHWTVSQSFFFVQTRAYNMDLISDEHDDIHGIGTSSLPLTVVVGLGGAMILMLFLYGFRRYPRAIPLVRSNSLAISAACHSVNADKERISLQELQYGVTSELSSGRYKVAFSAQEVMPLIPGQFYE